VFIEPLLRNGLINPVLELLLTCVFRALSSNDRCLQSHRLATVRNDDDDDATIYLKVKVTIMKQSL
jgi:hypothetical protein